MMVGIGKMGRGVLEKRGDRRWRLGREVFCLKGAVRNFYLNDQSEAVGMDY